MVKMDRKEFLKISALFSLSLTAAPLLATALESKISKSELMGRTTPLLEGNGFNLRGQAAQAFTNMKNDAAKLGIKMYSQSSYRSFDHQLSIWTRKYNLFTSQGLSPKDAIQKIVMYSTIPGTSRHHWGTDLDIIDVSKPIPSDPLHEKHFTKGGLYEALQDFLVNRAHEYGFYLVYTNDKTRKGFEYEPWHLSYKELSVPMLQEFKQIDLMSELLNLKIKGSAALDKVFIEKYIRENVLGINKALL